MEIELRPYQQDAVNLLRKSYSKGFEKPIFVLPTGAGKTYIFCYITANAVAKGSNVLILVHRQELLKQCSTSLNQIGIPHGFIAAKMNFNAEQKVQIASVQTLVRRMDKIQWQPDFIIIDEAHHAMANSWQTILHNYSDAKILGVTATPCRLDGAGLGNIFDDIVIGADISTLTELGFLVPADVYAPPIDFSTDGLRTTAGDYNIKDVSERMERPTITGDVVKHYKKYCDGKAAICFCSSVAHAEHMADAFNEHGISAGSIDGKMNDTDRASRIEMLGNGQLQVLTSCDIISEGTDIPIVTAAILLRPTKSLSLFLQQVGRVLRPAPNKEKAIILDHVGNIKRHGFHDDPRDWSLDDRQKKKQRKNEEVEPFTCPACFGQMRKPKPDNCLYCGLELNIKKDNKTVIVDGELEKITKENKYQYGRTKKNLIARARTYGELVSLGIEFGYKHPYGWAKHIINSREQRAT